MMQTASTSGATAATVELATSDPMHRAMSQVQRQCRPNMPKKFISPPSVPVCFGAMSVHVVQYGIT